MPRTHHKWSATARGWREQYIAELLVTTGTAASLEMRISCFKGVVLISFFGKQLKV